ncbi:hypothetical protein INT45_002540, partial [Circinella minor]
MIIRAENTPDALRYNRPTESEIGILIVENNDESVNSRDIVMRTRFDSFQHTNEGHRHYDTLHYVLIFPEGDEGWTIMSRSNNETITVMQWYKYCFILRGNNDENELHFFGKLFQQYIGDGDMRNVGRRYILTFFFYWLSSPHAANYINIVGRLGKPDLFITCT